MMLRRVLRALLLGALLGALALALAVGAAVSSPAGAWDRLPPGAEGWLLSDRGGIRGVTIGPIESVQQWGRGYGTRTSSLLLDELARMGVRWVSITPFGRLWSLDDTHIQMDFETPYAENRRAVRRVIRQAHEHGMRVLLVPHLWIETGGWRGEIAHATDDGWDAYQRAYRSFVLSWARDAATAGADALSIGVECKSWSGRFGAYWTALIEDVRAAFPGLLTYSANWDEAEDVLFWDQLDLLGINAFYPLANHNGATDAEYRAGAEAAKEGVRALAELLSMPVVFVETGYTTRTNAAVEPWLWPDDMQNVVIDEREQERALRATFDAFLPEPWFAGFFLWRYYANLDDVSQEAIWGFSPHGKRAERLLAEVFATAWGVDDVATPWGVDGTQATWRISRLAARSPDPSFAPSPSYRPVQ